MRSRLFAAVALSVGAALTGCGRENAILTPQTAQPARPTASPTTGPIAQPQVVDVGFTHTATTDATFGTVAFYAPTSGAAAIITVKAGSQIVFTNDGTGAPHTASGLGSTFPATFDNTSGPAAFGSTIDATTAWSTGNLNPGQSSSVFTVGPPGNYFFGCAYHYNADGMRDVIVSQ